MSFDPEWSYKEAYKHIDKDNTSNPSSPFYQWIAHHQILKLEGAFLNGDRMALFAALRKCANHSIAMPEWVAIEFIKGYDQVLSCKANSWDTVFGRPLPKGTHINALRKTRQFRFAVYHSVEEQRGTIKDRRGKVLKSKRPIGPHLFEEVGRQFGLGKTLTEELYYEAKKIISPENT